jgi:hypothetical protein
VISPGPSRFRRLLCAFISFASDLAMCSSGLGQPQEGPVGHAEKQ